MESDLQVRALMGRTALITGAGSGIGRHLAIALAAKGAIVTVAGRRLAELKETAVEIERSGGDCHVVQGDVTDEDSVRSLVAKAQGPSGRLDIAINCAGTARRGNVDEFDLRSFKEIFDTNTLGAWLCMKHEILAMKPSGQGAIINIASNVGIPRVRPGTGAYAASKAALVVLTRTAALESIEHGIRINSISPGPVDTEMSFRPGEDRATRDARIASINPSGRVASLDEISSAVLWLCSDSAGYVVGHDLVVDGGASL
ncbi:SDR family NAD(P)-dependent oxidoreductase [Roseateles sp. NT4]|uniref:SDR family NAD(P)-dependent oxidoreductase n=1 Tax=Roseateles sp. NT4 TaxID=3453715 RepID=UPI003EEB4DCC